ncbi:MAG: S8 family peptidase [Micropepsaceae bacterium]
MLIEPALGAGDLHTVVVEWQTDDHHQHGHGTAMAGLALHGDLTAQLGDTAQRVLAHRLESVKLLAPDGFEKTDPNSYGAITQQAISLPEIKAPDRPRVFCMAVSNIDVSGAFPSAWSAALDQAAAGKMSGDEDSAPRRLLVVSAGNIEPIVDAARMLPQDTYPAEDPSQGWNVLTVGGYTDLNEVRHEGYDGWTALAQVGGLSPHSRTTVAWLHGQAPIKPEIVMEAGNRAKSPSGAEVLTFPSLSLLTTGQEMDEPLVPFQATSAATAQAARLAARLTAAHPEFWPETVRGLIVHSAEWTQEMLRVFAASTGKRGNYEIVRRFGYGVPDFDRANASAANHLALITQAEIQPFRSSGGRKFNECHYYELPIPNAILEQLENEIVELKITLSYFIEPNPGLSANIDPQRYQSHGLRFDLRRKGESVAKFKERVNASERDDPRAAVNADPDDNRWTLGPKAVSSGSLHCDVWTGPAIELLGRDMLCVKPVNGWWRNRASLETCNQQTRYALVVTIKTRSAEHQVDLYTPIKAAIDIRTRVEIEIPARR